MNKKNYWGKSLAINLYDRNPTKLVDETLLEVTNKKNYWGKSLAINLYDCDPAKLVDENALRNFVKELIEVINMVAHGPCYVDRFGDGNLHGFSAMQFIETSSVTVHLDDKGGRAFIDIFSCKDFDTDKAQNFAKDYYGAKEIAVQVMDR